MENNTRIVVYCCRNLRLFKDGDQNAYARSKPGLRVVAIPCSGKMEAHHLLKTLSGGVDGVLVLACAEKACQYMEGSMRSHKRMDYARKWLEELRIDPERLQFVHAVPMDIGALDKVLEEFSEKLKTFGRILTTHNS